MGIIKLRLLLIVLWFFNLSYLQFRTLLQLYGAIEDLWGGGLANAFCPGYSWCCPHSLNLNSLHLTAKFTDYFSPAKIKEVATDQNPPPCIQHYSLKPFYAPCTAERDINHTWPSAGWTFLLPPSEGFPMTHLHGDKSLHQRSTRMLLLLHCWPIKQQSK